MTSLTKLQKHLDSTLINLGLIISLGNCCIGYTGVCLSSIEDILKQHNGLSDNRSMYHLSIATSSLNFGAIIGALLYKKFEDHVGTLKAFALVDMLCLLFLSLQLVDLNVYYLVGGRFLYGIFMTMSLAMTPAFLNKMSKMFNPKIMGTLGSFNQLLIVFGMIVSYMLAYILPDKIDSQNISASIKWRIYMGFPIVFILIRLYAVLTRSQYKMVEENLKIQSIKCLASSKTLQNIQNKEKLSYNKRLIVGILVIASNQLSCINGIFFYARQMMDMVTDHNEELSKMLMLFLAFGQLLAAMMSGKLLNKYPRKTIFLIGQEVIIIILFLCFFFDMPNHFLSPGIRHFCLAILINLHVVIFNLTLGPICIFYCSEILSDLKYVILTLKILSMFFALTSDIMIHKLGIGTMFMIFGVISLVVCLYLRQNMQQTIGLDKEKIYESYGKKYTALPVTSFDSEKKPFQNDEQKNAETTSIGYNQQKIQQIDQ